MHKKTPPIFDIDDPRTIEQYLADIEWAMADSRLKETLPSLVSYIEERVYRIWDMIPDEDQVCCHCDCVNNFLQVATPCCHCGRTYNQINHPSEFPYKKPCPHCHCPTKCCLCGENINENSTNETSL